MARSNQRSRRSYDCVMKFSQGLWNGCRPSEGVTDEMSVVSSQDGTRRVRGKWQKPQKPTEQFLLGTVEQRMKRATTLVGSVAFIAAVTVSGELFAASSQT